MIAISYITGRSLMVKLEEKVKKCIKNDGNQREYLEDHTLNICKLGRVDCMYQLGEFQVWKLTWKKPRLYYTCNYFGTRDIPFTD